MSLRYEQAETLLTAIGIYTLLAEYDPTFVGTIPIDIDIGGSDVDVICDVEDFDAFGALLTANFGDQSDFEIVSGDKHIICRFACMNFTFEIYGEDLAVKQQNAYRHMEAERKLLMIGGDKAREEIRKMKRSGLKTEPAFARYFALEGDPYERLLEFTDMPLSEMMSALG